MGNSTDRIKELKKKLYGREFKYTRSGQRFTRKSYNVSDEWVQGDSSSRPSGDSGRYKKNIRKNIFSKRMFIGSVIFFVVSFAAASYVIIKGSNVFSLERVNISISGPVSIGGGKDFSVNAAIFNGNEVDIADAVLIVEFPPGVYKTDSRQPLSRERIPLGSISAGETVTKEIPLLLFGKKNEEKTIYFTLEARFSGSSAVLDKREMYEVAISSSPVSLLLTVPDKASIGQEFEIKVDVTSNTQNVLNDMVLTLNYPSGFSFHDASPKPSGGTNVWYLGDLQQFEQRTIVVRGVIDGRDGEKQVFSSQVGSKDELDDVTAVGVVYDFVSEETVATKPLLGLNIAVNGKSSPGAYIAKNNEMLRFDILWNSNSSTKIVDGKITAKFIGDIVDKMSVFVDNVGFYQSLNDTILWNTRTGVSDFTVIEPGESGKVSFSMRSLPLVDDDGRVYKNPEMEVIVEATGGRSTAIDGADTVKTTVSKKVKIETTLDIVPRAVYYVGPFANSGPLPPVADKETTYTIILSVTNTSNKVSDVVVKTTLPPYVRWLGAISPEGEDISFNEVGGEVVWNVGTVDVGAGFVKSAKEVAFQVGLTPSISQRGSTVPLTGEVVAEGKDTFTGTRVSSYARELSTRLSTDPYFSSDQAIILAQ